AVYDKQRRWFSEVIKRFGGGANYKEIFATAGNHPFSGLTQPGPAADTALGTPASGVLTVSGADITTILGGGSTVRLVFRVKTNRTGADSGGDFNSFGRGAVLLDDVQVQKAGGGFSTIGDFETAEQGGVGAIDNRYPLVGGLTSTDVWRTSGKPPT